jgi:hypothetical protein
MDFECCISCDVESQAISASSHVSMSLSLSTTLHILTRNPNALKTHLAHYRSRCRIISVKQQHGEFSGAMPIAIATSVFTPSIELANCRPNQQTDTSTFEHLQNLWQLCRLITAILHYSNKTRRIPATVKKQHSTKPAGRRRWVIFQQLEELDY